MSEDALEKALRYSKNHSAALSYAPDSLQNVIGCVVCNCIMVEPYTLQCGHTFCGKCLQSWTKERAGNSTCPTCRAPIERNPVFCWALRHLAHVIIQSYNADPSTTEIIPEESLELIETPSFVNKHATGTPIFDEEDQIYRCPHCSHEIEDDGWCSGCNVYFRSRDRYENGRTDDSWEETSFDWHNRHGILHEEGPDGNAQPVVSRSYSVRRDAHVESDVIGSDSVEEEDDMGSFIDDDEDHFASSRDGSADEPDLWAESDENEDFQKENEADDTSDDSLLEETREMNDSDLEVTDVRHRAIIMDDDD